MLTFTAEQKLKSRQRLRRAVKAGTVLRSLCCETCGADKTEAHHSDYSQPFNVTWLCHKCHMALHPAAPVVRCANGHDLTPDNSFKRGACTRCKACDAEIALKSTPNISEVKRLPSFCKAGHHQILANLYKEPSGRIKCRKCSQIARLRYREKQVS